MEQSLRVQIPPRPPISERFRLDSAIQLLFLFLMLRLAKVMPLLLATGLAAAPLTLAAGLENFNNFPVTGGSYSNGTFLGQDGSIWRFTECRGDQIITAAPPHRTPTLAKSATAKITSGTLSNGCGTLSFDWMRPFNSTCQFEVLINSDVFYTSPAGVIDLTNHVADLVINVGGNFTLEFRQKSSSSGQASLDNIQWTSHGVVAQLPPVLNFSPDITNKLTAYGKSILLDVRADENNLDPVHLWATNLPAGAVFQATNGLAPLVSSFSWTPAGSQTGMYNIAFFAGDKDGTNSRTFSIEVTPIYPYYHYAEGLTGAVLKAKLHEIISDGAYQLKNEGSDNELDRCMKAIHTDPANSNNVLYLYNTNSSVAKTLYDAPNGWNKEHCWPQSYGLSGSGPDVVDAHNLYAEDIEVNRLRANLVYDESDTNDVAGYRNPATNTAPQSSMDSDSWEPPPSSKGNVARAVFYMSTRYDGSDGRLPLELSNTPNGTNQMGILRTLLLWNAMDAPDDWERTRNELIYTNYQHNRNPFVDHPEWAESIWGTDSDSDGINDTYEIIAGTATNNLNSRFEASFEATLARTQVVCSLLSSGSVWRLYEGTLAGQNIAWRQIAETNRLEAGTLRFNVAPTNPATFYHLRAYRP